MIIEVLFLGNKFSCDNYYLNDFYKMQRNFVLREQSVIGELKSYQYSFQFSLLQFIVQLRIEKFDKKIRFKKQIEQIFGKY